MSCNAFATSSTKQLNLLNDAICAVSLDDLARDVNRHRSGVERRCQSEIVEVVQRAREAEPPGLDPAVLLDVRGGFQKRAVEIEIRRESQKPVWIVGRKRWNASAIHHLDGVGSVRRG